MSNQLRVAVSGAGGRMGREVVEAVMGAGIDMALAGAADPVYVGQSVSDALGLDSQVLIQGELASVMASSSIDSVVVFSLPSTAMDDIRAAMKSGAVPVVGTTGISQDNLAEIRQLSRDNGVGAIIAPNFAIGAILMMKVAGEIAKYMPAVEIIEYHHD
ncbi:MAG TPA: 4-hydroxy-tetrahydrodipicolinate reductase, partial [Armatimonadota bacterium]